MHGQSAYPLEGRHAGVECRKCHKVDQGSEGVARLGPAAIDLRPRFAFCTDCHADDHAGQLEGRYADRTCAACHTVTGFDAVTIGVGWHASTRFALVGAHARLECDRCHGMERPGLRRLDPGFDPGKAKVALALPERECLDCHVDVHRGRYQEPATRMTCTDCHTQEAFVPSSVDFAQHDGFAFPLRGAHQATPCFLCHQGLDSRSHLPPGTHALIEETPPPDVVLWNAPTACQSCHRTEES
jgi:hypothetical protein